MTAATLRCPDGRDKSGRCLKPSDELLERTWEEWLDARAKAMRSSDIRDGVRAGRTWASWLKLFERS